LERKPDLVLVYGDVNSTMAAALVCSKLGVRVGHVEAGLRSRDRSMPEEINRIITDQLSDILFPPSEDESENLLREGIDESKIHLVGNVMIDTLVRLLPQAERHFPVHVTSPYALVTLHRPSNVDDLPWLRELLATLEELGPGVSVIFPVHPRTRQRMAALGTVALFNGRLRVLDPLPYLDFLALQRRAAMVITDSGGIQEESTYLGIPCITVRENTERPVTITHGTNRLVGRDFGVLRRVASEILREASERPCTQKCQIPLWDGQAAERIADVIVPVSAPTTAILQTA
jgi:UDP-N-acetylglucosamine 2-epimerase (non-hydrolysing)